MKTGQDNEPTFDLELANVMSGIGPSRADYCLHRLPCQGHKRSSLDVFAYALYQNTTSWAFKHSRGWHEGGYSRDRCREYPIATIIPLTPRVSPTTMSRIMDAIPMKHAIHH